MPPPRLILASASPRRQELLCAAGVDFEVVVSAVVELDGDTAGGLSPTDLAVENGRRKARAVARLHPGRWVLGADTVVALEGRIFGKPASLALAASFLERLAGHTHQVITGGVLIDPAGTETVFHDLSDVTFRPLSGGEIARYLGAVNVLDKAGAYALQEHGDWIVERVQGSEANVVGLPVEKLSVLLRERGLL